MSVYIKVCQYFGNDFVRNHIKKVRKVIQFQTFQKKNLIKENEVNKEYISFSKTFFNKFPKIDLLYNLLAFARTEMQLDFYNTVLIQDRTESDTTNVFKGPGG